MAGFEKLTDRTGMVMRFAGGGETGHSYVTGVNSAGMGCFIGSGIRRFVVMKKRVDKVSSSSDPHHGQQGETAPNPLICHFNGTPACHGLRKSPLPVLNLSEYLAFPAGVRWGVSGFGLTTIHCFYSNRYEGNDYQK